MKNALAYIGKNLHAVFYGVFTAYLDVPILSWTFFIGMFCMIGTTMLRDYLNGYDFITGEDNEQEPNS